MYSAGMLVVFDLSHKPLALKTLLKHYFGYNINPCFPGKRKQQDAHCT